MENMPDLEEAHRVAVEAAFSAGHYLRSRLWTPFEVDFKGEVDLVTECDRRSEAMILEAIGKAFPAHRIVAEESAWRAPRSAEGACWIIDPLDGTTNFVHGIPHFGVSIALLVDGETHIGVVYDPCRDELFEAHRGRGARLNGRRIDVRPRTSLEEAVLATGFPYDRPLRVELARRYLEPFLLRCRGIRRFGSASLDLAWVACGRLDGFWEFTLKPWDVAAGLLIVEEAGGAVANGSGEKPRLDDPLFLAASTTILPEMLDILASRQSH